MTRVSAGTLVTLAMTSQLVQPWNSFWHCQPGWSLNSNICKVHLFACVFFILVSHRIWFKNCRSRINVSCRKNRTNKREWRQWKRWAVKVRTSQSIELVMRQQLWKLPNLFWTMPTARRRFTNCNFLFYWLRGYPRREKEMSLPGTPRRMSSRAHSHTQLTGQQIEGTHTRTVHDRDTQRSVYISL